MSEVSVREGREVQGIRTEVALLALQGGSNEDHQEGIEVTQMRQLSFCPFPQVVGRSVQDQHIGKGAYGIGTIGWDDERALYHCLANVGGCLCIVEVNVTVGKGGLS